MLAWGGGCCAADGDIRREPVLRHAGSDEQGADGKRAPHGAPAGTRDSGSVSSVVSHGRDVDHVKRSRRSSAAPDPHLRDATHRAANRETAPVTTDPGRPLGASRDAFERISRTVAGGESSYARLRAGTHLVIETAAGARIRDADGNEYLDYCGGYGVNLFGHHPAFVWEAVQETVARTGVHIAFPHRLAGEVGELVAELVPGHRAASLRSIRHRGDTGGDPARPGGDRWRGDPQVRGSLPRLGRSPLHRLVGRERRAAGSPRLGWCPELEPRRGVGAAVQRSAGAGGGRCRGRPAARRRDPRAGGRLRRARATRSRATSTAWLAPCAAPAGW